MIKAITVELDDYYMMVVPPLKDIPITTKISKDGRTISFNYEEEVELWFVDKS